MTADQDRLPTVFCLPHGGASVVSYATWRAELSDAAEVVLVELPGRGIRRRDPLVDTVPGLVDAVWPTVRERAGGPVVLYGHSLGSLVAYELAHRLTDEGEPPALLAVSGRNGPSRASEAPPAHHLPHDEFVAALASFEGTPAQVLEDDRLMEVFLPQLRSDLRAAETYDHRPRRPLGCDLLVLEGRDDHLVSADGVRAWELETAGRCEIAWYPGGHFFHQRPGFAGSVLRPRLAALRSAVS